MFIHGKDTFISLAANNLSPFTSQSQITKEADTHDVTAYGKQAHDFQGGLKNGAASMEGTYDNSAGAGPRSVIGPLIGTVVELIRRPEGTGTTKPQDRVQVLVQNYVETSPVADMVSWSCAMQMSGIVDTTAQA